MEAGASSSEPKLQVLAQTSGEETPKNMGAACSPRPIIGRSGIMVLFLSEAQLLDSQGWLFFANEKSKA